MACQWHKPRELVLQLRVSLVPNVVAIGDRFSEQENDVDDDKKRVFGICFILSMDKINNLTISINKVTIYSVTIHLSVYRQYGMLFCLYVRCLIAFRLILFHSLISFAHVESLAKPFLCACFQFTMLARKFTFENNSNNNNKTNNAPNCAYLNGIDSLWKCHNTIFSWIETYECAVRYSVFQTYSRGI